MYTAHWTKCVTLSVTTWLLNYRGLLLGLKSAFRKLFTWASTILSLLPALFKSFSFILENKKRKTVMTAAVSLKLVFASRFEWCHALLLFPAIPSPVWCGSDFAEAGERRIMSVMLKFLTIIWWPLHWEENFTCLKIKASTLQQRESGMVSPKISAKSHCRKAEERKHSEKVTVSALCKIFSNWPKSEETSSDKSSKTANTVGMTEALSVFEKGRTEGHSVVTSDLLFFSWNEKMRNLVGWGRQLVGATRTKWSILP